MRFRRLAQALHDFAYTPDRKAKHAVYRIAEGMLAQGNGRKPDWRKTLISSAAKELSNLAFAPHEEIGKACYSILNLSKLIEAPVSMEFNKVRVTAHPDSTVREMVDKYHRDHRSL